MTLDHLWQFLAGLAPRRLVYWCGIRLGAHATVGRFGATVPDLTLLDALERWGQSNEGEPEAAVDIESLRHHHEPEIPRALDDEGRCRECLLIIELRDERAKAARYRAEVEALEARLDEAQLLYIEASNPGIDMDAVRRTRAGEGGAR